MDENDGGRTDNLAKGKGRLGQYTHNQGSGGSWDNRRNKSVTRGKRN